MSSDKPLEKMKTFKLDKPDPAAETYDTINERGIIPDLDFTQQPRYRYGWDEWVEKFGKIKKGPFTGTKLSRLINKMKELTKDKEFYIELPKNIEMTDNHKESFKKQIQTIDKALKPVEETIKQHEKIFLNELEKTPLREQVIKEKSMKKYNQKGGKKTRRKRKRKKRKTKKKRHRKKKTKKGGLRKKRTRRR